MIFTYDYSYDSIPFMRKAMHELNFKGKSQRQERKNRRRKLAAGSDPNKGFGWPRSYNVRHIGKKHAAKLALRA